MYLALGIISLGVAFIGVVLPLIPTTGPVILSAFFFARSSESFDEWLVSNRLFGGIVRDWRAGVGFTPRAKAIAVAAIVTTFTISVLFVIDSTVIRALLILLGISIATFVVTRPTKSQPTDTAITIP
ncbi:MAG: YbaN family protein [Acidimicrobiia bacterium]|nr:MAG: YbaN family protein [Acidimicrobiia bacterium]